MGWLPDFSAWAPVRAEHSGTYAVSEAGVWTRAHFWDHPLREVVTAACNSGLRLEFLHEHPRPAGMTYHAGSPDAYPDAYLYLFSIRATAPARRRI